VPIVGALANALAEHNVFPTRWNALDPPRQVSEAALAGERGLLRPIASYDPVKDRSQSKMEPT